MKIKIVLENRTRWDDADLKAFLMAGIAHCGLDGEWHVSVRYSKGLNQVWQPAADRISGLGWFHRHRFQLNIPKDGGLEPVAWAAALAKYKAELPQYNQAVSTGQIRCVSFREMLPVHKLPHIPWDEIPETVIKQMARVLVHEVDHCRGLRHRDMRPISTLPDEWATGLRIRAKAPAQPVKLSDAERAERRRAALSQVVTEREKHARAKVAEWERRLARAKTALEKWRRKVSYYERKAASNNQES